MEVRRHDVNGAAERPTLTDAGRHSGLSLGNGAVAARQFRDCRVTPDGWMVLWDHKKREAEGLSLEDGEVVTEHVRAVERLRGRSVAGT